MQTISDVRQQAIPTYPAEYLTVDDHVATTVTTSGQWIEKPKFQGRFLATYVKLQTLDQNIRYTIDGSVATSTRGFQLAAGSEALIPVPNQGVSIASELGTAELQYQWIR